MKLKGVFMNRNLIHRWLFAGIVAATCIFSAGQSSAQQTTAFTYQGQLHDGGTNANGAYTMVFALYDSASGGNQIGSSSTNSLTLANGLFTVNLDFGANAFNGSARWLDITVTSGTTTQTLSPRVQMLPAPYAIYSASAANLASGTWNASVGNYQTYSNVFGIYAGGSLVLGLSTNGVSVNGNLEANGLSIGNNVSINSDGNGGLDLNNGNSNANLTVNNLTMNGNTIQLPAQSGANIAVNGSGDFTFDNNIKIGALGVLHFPGPSNGGGDISGINTGLLISSGVQENGNLSVFGNVTCNPPGEFYGTLNQSSDRNLKEKFTPIDNQEILERLASLPISSWNYKQDVKTRHVGPMAQDFYAAFNVGTDDKHISTVDEGGVALAAIQGLNEKLDEKDAEFQKLKSQNESLEKRLADLEQLVKTFAQK
jgi:hypothetical protein